MWNDSYGNYDGVHWVIENLLLFHFVHNKLKYRAQHYLHRNDRCITADIQCIRFYDKQRMDKNLNLAQIKNRKENVTQFLLKSGIAFLTEKNIIINKSSSDENTYSVIKSKDETNHDISNIEHPPASTPNGIFISKGLASYFY